MFSVAIVGSRNLAWSFLPLVSRVVAALVASGASSFSVGCASGADALARVSVQRARSSLVVFRVSLAGGVPARAALMLRSRACVASVAPSGVVVAFWGSVVSPGTFGACKHALSLGLPVFAFVCGPFSLPSLGAGCWVAVASGSLAGSFAWQPAASQSSLF